MGVVTDTGKASVTEYRTLDQNTAGAMMLVTLHTGRTHQIRVHFAAIGHALYGDGLYSPDTHGFNRQALHCAHLRFWQPLKHKLIDLHAPLPADMATLAAKLRLSQQD